MPNMGNLLVINAVCVCMCVCACVCVCVCVVCGIFFFTHYSAQCNRQFVTLITPTAAQIANSSLISCMHTSIHLGLDTFMGWDQTGN